MKGFGENVPNVYIIYKSRQGSVDTVLNLKLNCGMKNGSGEKIPKLWVSKRHYDNFCRKYTRP
jgi:hypothetical protein